MYLENEWKRLERVGIEVLQAGDSAGAERSFRRCLELRPDLRTALFNMGSAHRRTGDYQNAIVCFDRII